MIEYFLDPHPDEVLYSVWARLSECLRYLNRYDVMRELFGTANAVPIVDLPYHLGYFLENLPSGHSYTLDILIDQHTLYPLYAPFLPEDRLNRLREQMISGDAHSIHQLVGKLGNTTNTPSSPPWLRYCPACVEEDRAKYGECYWHRLHQVLGVEVCPKHDTFLENSTVRTRATYRISQLEFVPAEQVIGVSAARKATSSPVTDVLREVARAISTLLERPYLLADDHYILRQYHALLAQRGFMTLNGLIRVGTLLNAFAAYYPPELLSLLQCEIKLTRHTIRTWLTGLLHRSGSARHPLQHVLLIHFLGATIESFLGREMPYPRPFLEGPWPCLNPTCEHYRQRHIQECQASEEQGKGLLVGRFTCSCGFVYSRSGPDRSKEDLFRRDKILAYGPLWEAKLRELWFDPSIKLQEIADQLGVVLITVNRQAERLQLPVPRTSCWTPRSGVKPARRAEKDLSRYRAQWVTLVNATPGASVTALRKSLPGVYWWLKTHDKEWLMANRPPSRQKQKPKNQIPSSLQSTQKKTVLEDLNTWDMQMADAVRTYAQQIINASEYPKKVTKRKILITVPDLGRFERYRAPLTALALQEMIETPETFALRRIQWFMQKCQREQRYPKRKEFIRSINIDHVLHLPRVLHALNEAMETLSFVKCEYGSAMALNG
jgi:Tn7-like transposition protein D/TniQ